MRFRMSRPRTLTWACFCTEPAEGVVGLGRLLTEPSKWITLSRLGCLLTEPSEGIALLGGRIASTEKAPQTTAIG